MIAGLGSVLGPYAGTFGTAGTVSAPATPKIPAPGAGDTSSFADVFKSAVGSVASLQTNADQQITGMLTGAGDADLNKVTVSVEKADVAFQLLLQVRNKVVNAYQEMEKMQF